MLYLVPSISRSGHELRKEGKGGKGVGLDFFLLLFFFLLFLQKKIEYN